jgi:tetratricopeptide (TPR) repeat protein
VREKALGLEHPQVAESLGSLGRTLVRLERWEEAGSALERARLLWEKTSTPFPRGFAESLLGQAELLLARGRADEALPKLEQALLLAPADLRAELEAVRKRAQSPSSTRPLMAVPVP